MDDAGPGAQGLWPRPETVAKVLTAVVVFSLLSWVLNHGASWYSFWGELGNALWVVAAWAVGVRVWRGG